MDNLLVSVRTDFRSLTLATLQTKIDPFANSVDQDETAHNKPSHQDLHCLPFCSRFWISTSVCNNGSVLSKDGRVSLRNGVKGLNIITLLHQSQW